MRDLRLLHFLSIDSIGGVERQFASFLGHDPHDIRPLHGLFSIGGSIHPFFEAVVRERVAAVHDWKRAGGIKLPRFPAAVRGTYRTRVARRYAPGVALFWNSIGEVGGARAAKRAGLTTVYFERGMGWHPSRLDADYPAFLTEVDCVLANSYAGRRLLELARGYHGPIEVVRNAVRADMRPRDPRARELPTSRPLRLGTACRMVPHKGVALALHALRELLARDVDAHLDVAGAGPLADDLAELSRRLELEGQVRFLGVVDDMAGFYDSVDLVVHPALCEPCSNVLLESLARGVPVVAAAVDGNPEIVRDGETGVLVEPTLSLDEYERIGAGRGRMPLKVYDPAGDAAVPPRLVDPARLADAVVALVADAGRYRSASERAIADSLERFDAGTRLDGLYALLADILDGPAPS